MNNNIRSMGALSGAGVISSNVNDQPIPLGFPVGMAYTVGVLVLAALTALAAVFGLLVPDGRATGLDAAEHERVEAGAGSATPVGKGVS
ncbi:MAG: hypothetical protein ABWX74_14065 [Aeromicrobium sp.]